MRSKADEPRQEQSDQDLPKQHEPELSEETVKASGAARKLAEQKGIDLTEVEGTGKGGWITKSDIENHGKG